MAVKVLRLPNAVRTSSAELIGTHVNKTFAQLIRDSSCTILSNPLRASHTSLIQHLSSHLNLCAFPIGIALI